MNFKMNKSFAYRCLITLGVSLGFLFSLSTQPLASENEVTVAKSQLEKQIQLLDEIKDHLDPWCLARFNVLRQAVERVLNLINKNEGLGNLETLQEFNRLVLGFRYSSDWFSKIATDVTEEKIKEIQKLNTDIALARKITGIPVTKNIALIYSQINDLLSELVKANVSKNMQEKINNLQPRLADVIARGEVLGDTPPTFDTCTPLYLSIKTLYEDMNELSSGSAGSLFPVLFEIMVLNESYGSFSRGEIRLSQELK